MRMPRWPLIFFALLAASCATQPERVVLLDEARVLVHQLESDPFTVTAGGESLTRAQGYLRAAEQDFKRAEDRDTVEYKAYLALRHAQIVREKLATARLHEQIERATAERTELQLQARTREVRRRDPGSPGGSGG